MSHSKILIVLGAVVFLAGSANSSPEESVEVRKEYGGVANTPDQLMFTFLVRYMAMKYENDKEFARFIVQDNMKKGSEGGELFLQKMILAAVEISEASQTMHTSSLCLDYPARSKSDIYQTMDAVDDERSLIGENVYKNFKKTLQGSEKQNFKAWLDDSKDGYRHIRVDHAILYENKGIDVNAHLKEVCDKAKQEKTIRKQQ